MRSHPWLTATAVALVIAVTLVSLLGGWARSTPDGPVRVAAGADIEAKPFRVRLDAASARFTVAGSDAEPEQAYVVVDGQMELTEPLSVGLSNVVDAFTADLADALDPYGTPTEVAQASVRVVPDGSNLLGMGPGLSYDVEIIFIVAEASVPEQVTVSVHEHTWRPNSLDFSYGWYDAAPVARVTLDVAALPATRPESEGF